MKLRLLCTGLIAISIVMANACASLGHTGGGTPKAGGATRDARISTWRDRDGVCHTTTTPYVRANKTNRDKVRWRISDDYDCLEADDITIEIRFDKGDPSPFAGSCVLKNDRQIQCELSDTATPGVTDYSVWLGMQQEDPEIQIEM